MTVPPVVEFAEQIVRDAEFELRTGVEADRCACGVTALRVTPDGFVCAGCGAPRVRPSQSSGVSECGSSGAQGLPPSPPALGAVNLNVAPLRFIERREVLASRQRLYLECGHAIERAYSGWQHRARCAECAIEGSFR